MEEEKTNKIPELGFNDMLLRAKTYDVAEHLLGTKDPVTALTNAVISASYIVSAVVAACSKNQEGMDVISGRAIEMLENSIHGTIEQWKKHLDSKKS